KERTRRKGRQSQKPKAGHCNRSLRGSQEREEGPCQKMSGMGVRSSPAERRARGSDPTLEKKASRAVTWVFRALGPGLITGASDDDPSGIATYSQAGAQFGFSITWTLLLTYPLMAVVQEISARIGRTTGNGIAANLARHYPKWIMQTVVALLLLA